LNPINFISAADLLFGMTGNIDDEDSSVALKSPPQEDIARLAKIAERGSHAVTVNITPEMRIRYPARRDTL
jgi:hypothetical protein